ncbi:MAG: hypothetical protein IPJ77_10635 [Planctomycetes bacterium]|nr:hypothetical protein [Planctomycetota bacterium]
MKTLLCALSILTAPALAFQSVHVVNGGSGGALQAAIDAAADGDTVLVHGGSFGHVAITAKSLTLVAEPTLDTVVAGVAISSLSANQRVVVSGLEVSSTSMVGVQITNCLGRVRLDALFAHGATPQSSVDALVANGAVDVACTNSTFTGGAQIPTPGPNPTPSFQAGRGVVSVGSGLTLYECVVTGGDGQTGHFINTVFTDAPAGIGGAGLECDASSSVFAGRSAIRGGSGGMGRELACAQLPCGIPPTPGGAGGLGLSAALGANVTVHDTTVSGGPGGSGGLGGQCCPQTVWPQAGSGAAGSAEQGTITHLPGSGVTLSAPAVVRVGQLLPLQIAGTPGDTIFLAVSGQTRAVFDPLFSGVFLFGPAARRSSFGIVPGSGVLSVSIPVGTLPSGAQSVERFLQVLARNPAGQLRLGDPAFVTVLDPAF